MSRHLHIDQTQWCITPQIKRYRVLIRNALFFAYPIFWRLVTVSWLVSSSLRRDQKYTYHYWLLLSFDSNILRRLFPLETKRRQHKTQHSVNFHQVVKLNTWLLGSVIRNRAECYSITWTTYWHTRARKKFEILNRCSTDGMKAKRHMQRYSLP